MIKQNKIRYIEHDEMNKRLAYCKKYRGIKYGKKEDKRPIQLRAFIEDKMVEFCLTYKSPDLGVCTFVMRKDGAETTQKINGAEAYKTLSQYYKVPHISAPFSASPFLWKNEKYEGTRQKAIGYDLNSSYSYAMIKDMPDTSVRPRVGRVKAGEIGFDIYGTPVFEGHYSNWVFPLMESPFKRFVERWFKAKSEAKTKEEKAKAKCMLNFSVGYLQKVNPFLRATIIYYANKMIESLIDENTLYCNTDSIVSLVPRNDLKLGTGLGEFKIEHQGNFAFVGYNYQWDDSISYRGIPKSWFKPGFDILTDKIPMGGNQYYYNKEKNKIMVGEYNGR